MPSLNKLPGSIKLLMLAGVLVVSYPLLSKPSTTAKPEMSDAECIKDLQCWAKRHHFVASVKCGVEIEKLASYSVEWTDGWGEPKFPRIQFAKEGEGTLVYSGDKVKFQNGFGAWQPHAYQCKFAPMGQRVLDVAAVPGRLP